MAQIWLIVSVVALLATSQGTSAKRGCSAFGHSCYGGHGKRSGDPGVIENRELPAHQMGQEEIPPHPVYPLSGFSGLLPPGDDIIPVRDGGLYERDDNTAAREVMKYRLRNIVKQWVENYRRSQQNNDDAYLTENL